MPIITFPLPSILVCVNIFAGNTQFLWFLSTCMNEECKWGIHLILSTTVLNWLIILRFAMPNKITILEFHSKILTKWRLADFRNQPVHQQDSRPAENSKLWCHSTFTVNIYRYKTIGANANAGEIQLPGNPSALTWQSFSYYRKSFSPYR